MNIKVETEYKIATESFDHKEPRGCYGYFRNDECTKALANLLGPLVVLDLGCGAGGFVDSCIELGHNAIGIDGTDHVLDTTRPGDLQGHKNAWTYRREQFFFADITKPFDVTDDLDRHFNFSLIAAWEFLEHIEEADLKGVFDNVKSHLAVSGYFLGSIGDFPEGNRHRTVKSAEWWKAKFVEFGFVPMEADFFNGPWVRGRGLWGIPGNNVGNIDDGGFNFMVKINDN